MATVVAGRTWDANSTVASGTVTNVFVSEQGKNKYAPNDTPTGPNFKSVTFTVDAASAAGLQVNIPAIHGLTYYYPIPVGVTKQFITVADGSRAAMGDFIRVKGNGGTATFSGGIDA